MVEYSTPPREIRGIYEDLARDVFDREEQLRKELPIETTAGISTHLSGVADDWKTGHKSLRTLPVCNVFACQRSQPLGDPLKRLLTSLDASVNVLDDIIDTQELSTESRIALTVNAAFSATLLAENCPPDIRSEVCSRLRNYFTALFQIPLVEQQLFESLRDAETKQQRQRTAEEIYAYRSRDIDAFVRIAAVVSELDPEYEQQLLRDLRTYRAHRLLFKDIYDVERDLTDDDMTPVVYLLQQYDSIESVVGTVEGLYRRFSYSDRGSQQYGDILCELEDPPSDLHSSLQEKKKLVR
ncbi:hypothetical protein [Halostella sp. PRR32]|uniref:hypothetical protein n=1 Tax=Halostella sp. PRR32 TaxID=3098147 RepID=UPI002B1D797C|nr:hypothetical protein [Halostella sp. PRR32]